MLLNKTSCTSITAISFELKSNGLMMFFCTSDRLSVLAELFVFLPRELKLLHVHETPGSRNGECVISVYVEWPCVCKGLTTIR